MRYLVAVIVCMISVSVFGQTDVYGCATSIACNYNPDATIDDGSCEFTSCVGCTTPIACNFDSTATVHDPSACEFPEFGYDCNGSCYCDCQCDYDGDSICGVFCIPGCTDPEAINYDPTAEDDNGTCTYPVPGCMDSSACNFDATATLDDGNCAVNDECGICGGDGIPEGDCDCEGNQLDALGICGGDCEDDYNGNGVCDNVEIYGCAYPDAMNFDPFATADNGSCAYTSNPCPTDLDGNGSVGSPDLLIFLGAFGTYCE
jgi:hypothetical protein